MTVVRDRQSANCLDAGGAPIAMRKVTAPEYAAICTVSEDCPLFGSGRGSWSIRRALRRTFNGCAEDNDQENNE